MEIVESHTRNELAFPRMWRRATPSNRISIGGMAYSGGSGGNSDGDGSVKASFDTLLFWSKDLLEYPVLSGWQYPPPDIGVLSEGGTKNIVIRDKDEADHERLQAGQLRPRSILHRHEPLGCYKIRMLTTFFFILEFDLPVWRATSCRAADQWTSIDNIFHTFPREVRFEYAG